MVQDKMKKIRKWLETPRTVDVVIKKLGWQFQLHLPDDTQIASGRNKKNPDIHCTYYWIQTFTKAQNRLLNMREINIASAHNVKK